jgi:hypothetical protein
MGNSPFIVYVDESGDQGLKNFDPANPVFCLCAAVYEREQYLKNDLPALSEIKFRHWWHDAVIFHSYKIRQKVHPFQSLKDTKNAEAFMASAVEFFEKSTATLVAAAIDKPRHAAQYVNPSDPYELSLQFVLERTFGHIRKRCSPGDKTVFVFEKRGKADDIRTEKRFAKVVAGVNAWNRPLPFLSTFAWKEENIAGLQVADLAAYSISRYVETKREDRKDWACLKHLLRKSPAGNIDGWGLKVFP